MGSSGLWTSPPQPDQVQVIQPSTDVDYEIALMASVSLALNVSGIGNVSGLLQALLAVGAVATVRNALTAEATSASRVLRADDLVGRRA